MVTNLPEELRVQLHSLKNMGIVDIDKISSGSNKKVWWLSECGHEWEATPKSRSYSSVACRVCSGQIILIGFNDLGTTHPLLAPQWHPTRNNFLITSVTKGSVKKAWWLCDKGHEWEARIDSRVTGNNCPYCSGKKVLADFNSLRVQLPLVAREWDFSKNSLGPDDYTKGSRAKVWWLCDNGHEWETAICDRLRGTGCPICAGKLQSGYNDLGTLNKTLASEWHPTKNLSLTPRDITLGSGLNVWWLGLKCGHEWEATPYSRNKIKSGCPVCANQKVLAGFNDFATISPMLSLEWHPTKNDNLTPQDITSGSNKKVWWLGSCGHEWQATVTSRSNGRSCAACWKSSINSYMEKDLANSLSFYFPNLELSNRTILDGKELDIYIPEREIAIEFNGLYWHSEQAGKDANYHYDKWAKAKEANVQLIQIWEDDWVKNRKQIIASLEAKLGVDRREKVYARKTRVEILSNNESRKFLDMNHIQGFASGSYYLGLKDSSDNIVAVLVLKREAGTEGKTLNIIRYATNIRVVGGFTKLLAFAEKSYTPDIFITFSDHCISNGALYEKNGFLADKELAPDYMYIFKKERKHKFGYRLKRFKDDPNLLWEEGLTERELANLNNLSRIWDAGKTRWVKKLI